MENVILKVLVLGSVATNCYIIGNKDSGEAIVIDPADDHLQIEKVLDQEGLECKGILLTHGHFDHIMASNDLLEGRDISLYAHENEKELLLDPKLNYSFYVGGNYSVDPDVLLHDGQEIKLAGFNIKVIYTPGHTGGCVCYHFIDQDILFSGDSLFKGDIGRSDLPTGNGVQLVLSLKNKVMVLDDKIKVYPGHGPSTSIADERINNPYVR